MQTHDENKPMVVLAFFMQKRRKELRILNEDAFNKMRISHNLWLFSFFLEKRRSKNMNTCSLSGIIKNLSIKEKSGFLQLAVKEIGKEKEYVNYFTCKAFSTTMIQNLSKCGIGMFVLVKGRLGTYQYDIQKDGVTFKVYETYVVIDQLEYPINQVQQLNQAQNQYPSAQVQQPQVQPQQQPISFQQPYCYQPQAAVGSDTPPWQ